MAIQSGYSVHVLCRVGAVAVLGVVLACASTAPIDVAPEDPDETRLALLHGAAEADAGNADAWYALSNALFDLGRFEEAADEYRKTVTVDPKHVGGYCNLGLCLRRMGDVEGAFEAYEHALAIDPEDSTTLLNFAVALEADGRLLEALDSLERLTATLPDNVHAQSELGRVSLQVGRYNDAALAFRRVVDLEPGSAGDYYNLGVSHFYLDEFEPAREAWERTLSFEPGHFLANRGLAVLFWKRGEHDEAWAQVAECERLGIPLEPEFIAGLRKDSGRVGPS